MRAATEALTAGRRPGPDDFLPCRFTAAGEAPSGDGWGAFQMDGPGLWLWALERHLQGRPGGGRLEPTIEPAAEVTARYLATGWPRPSYDAWEEHPDHSSSSTLAACLAGLQAARRLHLGDDTASDAIARIRDELAARVSRHGSLPRSDGDAGLDASSLWCQPLLGVFAPDDAGWRETLARIEATLVGPGGGVYRYAADTFYGGGQWPVLTAALGLACLDRGAPGDEASARRCAAWIDAQRDPAGHLPEQASQHALQPASIAAWQARWGPVARPLTWSHAMAVLLGRAMLRGTSRLAKPEPT